MSPKKLSPNNLTSTQLGLLSAAAQREDGAIELAPNLKGGAADKVVGKLLRDGLIEESRRAARYRSGAVTRRRKRSRCASPSAALRPSGSMNIAHYWRLKKIAACPSGLCSASQENQSRGPARVRQAQPGRLKAGSGARDAPSETGRDHRDHHAGNRLAAPLGPRLFDGGGAHQARPDARLREDRRSARLPHRRKRCLAEAQSQAGPQGGVTGMPRPDRAAIETEIVRVRSLGLDALRTLWRVTFRSSPPPAFTKDLMARFLCWHIQEQARGGLDPETAKHLDGLARPGADRPRRLKPGTVFLREYQ